MPASNLEQLIASLAAEISQVPGVSAVVLGGSRARGTHTGKSDIDLLDELSAEISLLLEKA
jgi:predicted nucleotidyltransferase